MTGRSGVLSDGGARLAILAAILLVCLGASAGADAAPIDGIHNIQHVVVIMQENRSFDSYFGTYPGANGIPAGVCVPDPLNGGCVRPSHDPNVKNFGGLHGTEAAISDVDGGRMDGFVGQAEKGMGCSANELRCLPCSSPEAQQSKCIGVMGYHDAREIPNYWSYAEHFVLQDNMFESAASWSLPEHLFLVSGWSARCPNGASEALSCSNSLNPVQPGSGPGAPLVPGKATYAWTDLTYLLDKANVSWRYYIYEGSEPDCQSDETVTCKPVSQRPQTPGIWNPLPDFTDVKQDGQLGNIQSLNNFFTAVHNQGECALPNVSWIDPKFAVSEHPSSSISRGQAYVTTLINSIMRSPCWGSTAIFLSWDDWGGFYDHVVPPQIDQNGYGLHVPGVVISPYAKAGYIDHQQLSHDAYLKFIEDDFLEKARLNPATDGRPDNRPSVREEAPGLGDLANDFNFNQLPRPPLLLSVHPEPGPASKPPGPNPPTVETGGASSVTRTSATLNATVNPNSGAVSDCHFEYGTSTFYGASVPCASLPGSGESPVAVSASVTGLSPNTSYHFRIVGANPGGTGYGSDQTFTTLPNPPTVETGVASSVERTSATLNATVNPNSGAVSDCHFEYGTSTFYGASVPCASLPGSGESPVAVSASVTGLSPNTSYHFRIVGANPGGTGYGPDQTFTTAGPPDFGRCLAVPAEKVGTKTVYHGGFTTASCVEASITETGKYEWYPGVASARFTTMIKEGVATLETVRKVKVSCNGESTAGEYSGPKEVANVVVKFTGCNSLGEKCTTPGLAEGELETKKLDGVLGMESITFKEGREIRHVALDMFPSGKTGPFMEYACAGSAPTTLTGSILAPVTADRMLTTATLKFTATAGKQKPEAFLGGEKDVLTNTLSDQVGLTVGSTQTNEEAVEINAWF
jgi:phospholipase C